jgi:prepilin-type N-terminal cleavage/methylation domain-containing protein
MRGMQHYCRIMFSTRAGLTLVEVIVAMLVFAVGALGLAAGSAAIARQMSITNLRSRSFTIARSRDEKSHSSPCSAPSAGSEYAAGVHSTWQVGQGSAVTLDQQLSRKSVAGAHVDVYLSAAPCE